MISLGAEYRKVVIKRKIQKSSVNALFCDRLRGKIAFVAPES